MTGTRAQLAEVIGERTLHHSDAKELAREIASYLMSENLEYELESLMRDVMAYRESKGIVEATVLTAHDLSSGVEHDVEALLKDAFPSAKEIIVRETHDPSVIGGLKVQLAHEQLDLSVRAKLDTFKRLTAEGTK